MTRIAVTGATGFLGREVVARLLARGDEVHAIVRDASRCPEGATPHVWDICCVSDEPKLKGVDEVWHLAAVLDLGGHAMEALNEVNVRGTFNVVNWARESGARRFVLASTAYVVGPARNAYESSKKRAEVYADTLGAQRGLQVAIFRPSILVASTLTHEPPVGQGFYRFVIMLARVHRRAERIRRATEEGLRLPPLRPAFRVRGDPDAHANLIPVNLVADAMVEERGSGIFHLINPRPPTLRSLARWVGEALLLDARFERDFRMTPPEVLFHRLVAPFLPYLREEIALPSSALHLRRAPVDRRFILRTVARALGEAADLPTGCGSV